MRYDDLDQQRRSQAKVGRFVGVVFGLVFLAIGITVIVFMWTGDEGFGRPPLFFRIFASLIATAFVAMGGAVAYDSVRAMAAGRDIDSIASHGLKQSFSQPQGANYRCSACGAPLDKGADVSPHGDVKCTHCGSWFNVHKRDS